MRKITTVAGPLRTMGLSLLIATMLFVGNIGTTLASWTPGAFSPSEEQALYGLTEDDRRAASLFPMDIDTYLHSEAEWRAKDMADRNYFSHNIPPDGNTVFSYMQADGYCFELAGENIGVSTYGADATTKINTAFMASPDHRDNILGRWTNAGYGVYERSDGTKYFVELFSLPCGYAIPSTYKPITPARIYDSRNPSSPLHARTNRTFQVTGLAGVPANATAVTGNLTVVDQTRLGYVTISSGGSLASGVEPPTSTINFPVGDIRANDVTVPLSLDGKLDVMYWCSTSTDTANVIFDVTGYYENDSTGSDFVGITPAVALNTSTGVGLSGPFVSHTKRTFNLNALSAIPTTASAVAGNIIVNGQTKQGYVTVSTGGSLTSGVTPPTSSINFPTGDVRSNGIVVALGPNKTLDAMYWASTTTDTVQVTFEVTGYFLPGNTVFNGVYYPLSAPVRVLDSRLGLGATTFHSQVVKTLLLPVTLGSGYGVTGNLTVTAQTRAGFVSIAPDLTSGVMPTTHTLNFPTSDNRAIGVTVDTNGNTVDLMYWTSVTSDTTAVIFDESGYFGYPPDEISY